MDEFHFVRPYEQFYETVYRELDPTNAGFVSAAGAVSFLKTSNLPVETLGLIWEEADSFKRGALDRRGVFVALKLVAAAQQGHPVTASSLALSLEPPRVATAALPVPSSVAPSWGISAADQSKYDAIFDSLGPENGKLPGAKVRPVLLNSGLNANYLAKIWELADQDQDGQLDRVEMNIALHLVYRALQGEAVPRSLPPSLIHPSKSEYAANRRLSVQSGTGTMRSRAESVGSLNEVSLSSPTVNLPPSGVRPYSVQAPRAPSVASPLHTSSLLPTSGDEWPVNVGEYADHFAALDTDRDGLVSGADCRQLLLSSGQPQAVLAHLWSLVDTSRSGMLNMEQFALCCYLLKRKGSGEELPGSLPASLMPPSLRVMGAPGSNHQNVTSSIPASNEPLEDDEEALALLKEISEIEEQRKTADQNILQLETDLNAKKSQMKHLMVELKTLEGTLKQLEKQKGEANRRLAEMDLQRERVEAHAQGSRQKAADTQKRIDALLQESESRELGKEQFEHEIQQLRGEMTAQESENATKEEDLRQGLGALEITVAELSSLEREATHLERAQQLASKAQEGLSAMEKELQEASTSRKDCAALYDDFTRFSLNPPAAVQVQKAPFPDPFISNTGGAEMGGVNKAPPPRPAPPAQKKNILQDPFADTDPFSAVDTAPRNGGFADFANFSAFS